VNIRVVEFHQILLAATVVRKATYPLKHRQVMIFIDLGSVSKAIITQNIKPMRVIV
jgi:hypothetical protein